MTTTQRHQTAQKFLQVPPLGNEIKIAIKHLKLNKASGADNLPPEVFKIYPNTIANVLEPLLKRKPWNSGQIPRDWKEGLLKKLPKKVI